MNPLSSPRKHTRLIDSHRNGGDKSVDRKLSVLNNQYESLTLKRQDVSNKTAQQMYNNAYKDNEILNAHDNPRSPPGKVASNLRLNPMMRARSSRFLSDFDLNDL